MSLAAGLIPRNQPLTITWTEGDAAGYVDIQGQGGIGNQTSTGFVTTYSYYFDCAAPTSAGTFTIPSYILLPMPTGSNAFASLQVSTGNYESTAVSVPGLDYFLNGSLLQFNAPAGFK